MEEVLLSKLFKNLVASTYRGFDPDCLTDVIYQLVEYTIILKYHHYNKIILLQVKVLQAYRSNLLGLLSLSWPLALLYNFSAAAIPGMGPNLLSAFLIVCCKAQILHLFFIDNWLSSIHTIFLTFKPKVGLMLGLHPHLINFEEQ